MTRTLPDGLPLPEECPLPAALAPPPPPPRSAWVLAGVALLVRAAAALLDPVPPRDGIALAVTVRDLAGGSLDALLDASHPPLAALLAAPLAAAGADPVAALTVVAVLCAAAAALPLHALARRMFDGDAANGAVLLYAVTPPLVRIGSTALAEPPLFLLGLLSVLAALRALRHWRPARDAALAGLWGGAAFLARPEGLALLPLAALAPIPGGAGRPWRHRLLGAAAAVALFAALAGPWTAAGGARRDRVEVIPGKSASVLVGLSTPEDPGGAAPAERHSPGGAALQALGALPEALHPAVAALALLGVLSLFSAKPCGKVLGPPLFGLLAAGLFLGGVVLLEWRYGYGGRRHASMAGVLLLPFAGRGLLLAGEAARRAGGPLRRPLVALGAVSLLAAGGLLAGALLQRDRSGAEARALGLRLREIHGGGDPGPAVATFGEPRVAWYAGGGDVRLLRRFGRRPGAPPSEPAERAAALRWFLQGAEAPDYVVLRRDDDRVPPGIPGEAAGPPVAEEGALRAFRAAAIR